MASQKISRNNRYMLRGSLKKNGFDCWRFVFSGLSTETGEEKTFFIEYYIINPSLSPNEYVLGFKDRMKKSTADLQYALAGTKSVENACKQIYVQPSFVMIKAGYFSRNGKQINAFFSSSHMEIGKHDYIFRAGTNEKNCCSISETQTTGSIIVTYSDLTKQPEMLCNAGSIDWNLRYERVVSTGSEYKKNGIHWDAIGVCSSFSGLINVDGEEFKVVPKSSFGYIDKNWGHNISSPYFHLSSSNLTSTITGKPLVNSCFVAQGEHEGKLSVFALIDNDIYNFSKINKKKLALTYECSEMPKDDDGVKIHWSVSINDKKNVLDIDIFCKTDEMFIRGYESPEGGRKVMKILGGGTGIGELRLYHKVKKNLELIEHATVSNAVCEFGDFEYPED